MNKKIIVTLVLLIFAQQEFYGSDYKNEGDKNEGDKNEDTSKKWETINDWVNINHTKDYKKYPKLWWLWAITDNVPIQYGNSKIWKHGEAYYGLSNGIGFFPSILNFRWLKIGIIDAHINVINLILDYFKNFIQCATRKKFNKGDFLVLPILINCCFNIHILSVKILNSIKIKLIAPIALILTIVDVVGDDEYSRAWYITYNANQQISWWYALLSPRIEINIPELINYFRKQ